MSAATDFTEKNIINALMRGQPFVQATRLYIALHTADPSETGAMAEVTTSKWPSYTRVDAAVGGAISTGWADQPDGSVKNARQLIYPVYDGSGTLTVTHYSVKDSASGGNTLIKGQLTTPQNLTPGNVFVFDAEKLTVRCS